MLKYLEISGFKSFADKTKMEFSPGVSALVGPNGSGKSNIVDAIKWVLGEQSVKKLRGNEMTDVIFNGSSSRQPLNSAEVTLTFDNAQQFFTLETPEVQITRRIYRNGETEYLINRQARRLKDVRDLLFGSGLGVQAYSIIEQGRVEALLQSSSVQRRAIFEEAAGIAKFNAKKQEVQRRLERVEQNLLRLSDMVNEVGAQRLHVKNQAGKARLYRQYTTRLQALRMETGRTDWQRLVADLQRLSTENEEYSAKNRRLDQELAKEEKDLATISQTLESFDQNIRQNKEKLTSIREKIAAEESSAQFNLPQLDVLQKEITEHGKQLLDLNIRSGDTVELMRQTDAEIESAKKTQQELSLSFQSDTIALEETIAQCNQLLDEKDKIRKTIQEKNIEETRITSNINSLETKRRLIEESQKNTTQKMELLNRQKLEISAKFGELEGTSEELLERIQECKTQYDNALTVKKNRENELIVHQQELSEMKQQQSGWSERVSLLQDLFRKHEGLSPGVKEVLSRSKNPESPFRHVYGLVADLIRVNVEAAALIELALGQTAQYVVVSPEPELFRYIEQHAREFAGRVGFIWLDPNPVETSWMQNFQYDGLPGVLGRADQFIETDNQFLHLFKRLLCRTWIVETLADAKTVYRDSDGRTNFLTVSGECLASDGTLIVGPSHGSMGLITRRSELRSLSDQLQLLDRQIREKEATLDVLKVQCQKDEQHFLAVSEAHLNATKEMETLHLQKSAAQERDQQTQTDYEQLEKEYQNLNAEWNTLKSELEKCYQAKSVFDQEIQRFESQLTQTQIQYEKCSVQRQEKSRKLTNLKIELAKSEERFDYLSAKKKQFEDSQQERNHLLNDHIQRDRSLKTRWTQTELAVLTTDAHLATLYHRKEHVTKLLSEISGKRQTMNMIRLKKQKMVKSLQQDLIKNRERLHSISIEQERLQQEQKTLCDRMREDYGVEMSQWTEPTLPATQTDLASESQNALVSDTQTNTNTTSLPQAASVSEATTDGNASAAAPPFFAENTPSAENIEKPQETQTQQVPHPSQTTQQSQAVQQKKNRQEIQELRDKIQQLGSVNLESIELLENLETRYQTLFNQFSDLQSAKKSILKIVERIEEDSVRLFIETFESVKIYFVDLFQKLFGGGHVDLVLENPEHPLEGGIDIAVRPPGKELKSVSLLSGGEKTLTCVALLLAIFQYRSTPVCILDEVDAALDEGNVDRFVRVIKTFNTQTQFLLITHSKKTMTAAKAMYGITMQESGVSKLIAVEFDDVSEDGEITLKTRPSAENQPNQEHAA